MKSAQAVIEEVLSRYSPDVVLTTSFQKSGMVVLDLALRVDPTLRVLTIDTGRLPESTYRMIERVRDRYKIQIELVYPDPAETETMVTRHGADLFYKDRPSRLLCCRIRKVRPLERYLTGVRAVFTGLRRGQSETRESIPEIDTSMQPVKASPLANWSAEEVEDYTRSHDLPVHPLYAQGFTSIGCAPCTRPTFSAQDDSRDGRWWWESDGSAKECGLHFTPDGRVQSSVDVMLEEIVGPVAKHE